MRDQLTRARTPQTDWLAIVVWGGALCRRKAGGRERDPARAPQRKPASWTGASRALADPAGEAVRTLVDEYGEGDDKVEDGVPPVEVQEHLQRQVRTHLVAVRHHRALRRGCGGQCACDLRRIKVELRFEKGFFCCGFHSTLPTPPLLCKGLCLVLYERRCECTCLFYVFYLSRSSRRVH